VARQGGDGPGVRHRLSLLDDVPPPIQPPPVPEGWRLGPPDFVGVGTMKSGTSWWWSVVTSHPAIVSSRSAQAAATHPGDSARSERRRLYAAKEIHFFDHFGQVEEIDPEDYHRYFPRPAGLLAGEWTPRYMYDFWVPPMLRAVAPRAKLLVMLRDPLNRLVSALSHHRLAAHSHAAVMEHQFHRGLYWQQLRMLTDHFERDQMLVLQYEQCVADPAGQARRTFEFLGVDPGRWRPDRDLTEQVGASFDKPSLNEATRETLCRALASDLARLLRDYPGIDATLWPSVHRLSGENRGK
jgi:hypothetical protein